MLSAKIAGVVPAVVPYASIIGIAILMYVAMKIFMTREECSASRVRCVSKLVKYTNVYRKTVFVTTDRTIAAICRRTAVPYSE